MRFSRGITSSRLLGVLSGYIYPIIKNGYNWINKSDYVVYIDGSGGGSHYGTVTYDTYGTVRNCVHTEQTGSGNAYYFIPVDTYYYKFIRLFWRGNITTATGKAAIGLIPRSVGVPSSIVAGITAGNSLLSVYSGQGALEIATTAVTINPAMVNYDISALQGQYYLYMESIGSDGTSSSKVAGSYVYNVDMVS